MENNNFKENLPNLLKLMENNIENVEFPLQYLKKCKKRIEKLQEISEILEKENCDF